MGRHSAPDSDEQELSTVEVRSTSVIPWGRHAGDDVAELDQGAEPAAAEPHTGTRGDLHLLRESSALRMRCAAAVLVPFVIYTVVLVAIGRTDVYLIWLWIPTILAGVLIGAFLDFAHRRLRSTPVYETGPTSGGVDVAEPGEESVDDH